VIPTQAGPELPKAAIVGLVGPDLQAEEATMLRELRPCGAILFARNIVSAEQTADLIAGFRDAVGDPAAPVLVDQEGGRVARLPSPPWRRPPAAKRFGALAAIDPIGAERAVWANARAIGEDLRQLGFSVACAPVLDLGLAEGHGVIGDRAFGGDPGLVARLGLAAIQGFQASGIVPVCKHFPGHGRARADSHLELPEVDAEPDDLSLDLAPFASLTGAGAWWMTSHCRYPALDPQMPGTLSPRILQDLARDRLGFQGPIVSDDLAMQALAGTPPERAMAALLAGCDLALWCPGGIADTRAVLEAVPALSPEAFGRMRWAGARVSSPPVPVDVGDLAREVEILLGTPVA